MFSATAGEGTAAGQNVHAYSASTLLLLTYSVAPTTVYLNSYTTGGVRTSVGNWLATNTPKSMVNFGTPTASYTFIADPGGGITMRRYDGAAVAASTGAPYFVTVTPVDNRLVQAGFAAAGDSPSGANGSPSTVFFSDPGAPTTFTATSYIHLRPGDGEQITGIAAFANEVYVFKRTAFWVFYGTTTDSSGNPIFQTRRVDLPSPIVNVSNAAAGETGVFFSTRDGLWKTAGGPPVLVSGKVADIFNPAGTATLELTAENLTTPLVALGGRIYFAYTIASVGRRWLIYDERLGVWTVWSVIAPAPAAPAFWPGRGEPRGTLYFIGTDEHIYKMSNASTTDAGAAIASSYQSGWAPIGDPRADGTAYIRGISAWGLGSPTISVLGDYATSDTQAAAMTLGSTTPARGLANRSYMARLYAFKIAATSGAWSVDSITLNEYP